MTAVEWLIDNLKPIYPDIDNYKLIISLSKDMEKQQIIEAHGLIAKLQEDGTHKLISGETYYNKTYKPST